MRLGFGRDEHAEVRADQFALGVAEHLGECVVDVGVAVVEHHVDADLAVLDQRAIAQFRALQGPLREAPRGDVLRRALDVQHLAVRVAHDLGIQIHEHVAAVAMFRREFEASNESVSQQRSIIVERSSGARKPRSCGALRLVSSLFA